MLDAAIKEQLKSYLDTIDENIVLEATLDNSPTSDKMRELLQEISSLSDKVGYAENGNSSRRPSFFIINPNKDIKINFAAIPLGHEFNSLVLAMLQVGTRPIKIGENLLNMVKNIDHRCDFTVYISLTCQNCPNVVQALNIMAILNPNISSTIVDGSINIQEVENLGIRGVPTIYLNNKEFYLGRMSLEEILNKLGAFDTELIIKEINNKAPFDVLVIGGGPAGSAAAIYASRKGIRTGMVSEKFGGQILDTLDIENFISVKKTEGPKLVADLENHVKVYDIDIINAQKATGIKKEGDLFKVALECGANLKARVLIIASGARWRKMGVSGEEEYLKKGIVFCPHCDAPLYKGKTAAVIGGGNSGAEAAIDLGGIANKVVLLEFADALKADKVLQKKLATLPNVEVITNAQITQVFGDGKKITSFDYIDRKTGEKHNIQADGIFVQIGLIPNSEWLKGAVDINKRGEVIIDDKCQTSKEGIFAAGDVTTVPYKQVIIAMGAGATAALSAFDYLIRK